MCPCRLLPTVSCGHDASCPAIITVYFTESEITKKDTANITITSSGGG
ncbi:hypothetical protein KJ830_06675 [bacterium]|nr:hypothetical protein [bacterium]